MTDHVYIRRVKKLIIFTHDFIYARIKSTLLVTDDLVHWFRFTVTRDHSHRYRKGELL
jgi:hypothetical protein